jgi:hypothetical protein
MLSRGVVGESFLFIFSSTLYHFIVMKRGVLSCEFLSSWSWLPFFSYLFLTLFFECSLFIYCSIQFVLSTSLFSHHDGHPAPYSKVMSPFPPFWVTFTCCLLAAIKRGVFFFELRSSWAWLPFFFGFFLFFSFIEHYLLMYCFIQFDLSTWLFSHHYSHPVPYSKVTCCFPPFCITFTCCLRVFRVFVVQVWFIPG